MVLTGEYSWSQSIDDLKIEIPLKGKSPNSVDIYVSRVYVKINFAPYLINIDLYAEVEDETGVSTVNDGVLSLTLAKREKGTWPSLECSDYEDKSRMRERRTNSMEEKRERTKLAAERLRERKLNDEKTSTRMQMKVDEAQRQRLDDLKAEEKRQAEESVYETLRKLEQDKEHAKPRTMSESSAASSSVKGILKTSPKGGSPRSRTRSVSFSEAEDESIPRNDDIPLDDDEQDDDEVSNIFSEADCLPIENEHVRPPTPPKPSVKLAEKQIKGDDLDSVMPAPREATRVKLTFTPRVFPTPMRESKKEEEEDWLIRNRRHLKGSVRKRLDGVDISERDPMWLKEKGDNFFKNGNFEGALNAYACALELDEQLVSCLSNRAACFIKLGHYERCVDDCTTALQMLQKERDEEVKLARQEGFAETPKELKRTKAMRKKLYIRKGTAYNRLGKHTEALTEYQFAQEMEPNDEGIKADVARLNCLVQSSAQKDLADTAFRAKDFDNALALYNKAIEYNPESAASLSNRSACHLKLGNIDAAISDCKRGLEVLVGDDTSNVLKTKLLTRLAGMQVQSGDNASALENYKFALEINPTDLSIAKKLKSVELLASD